MNRLEPGQLWVMRIHAIIFALVLAVGAIVAETALVPELGLPRGPVAGLVLILVAYIVFVSPGRHYRAWAYVMDEEDLRIRRGVWIETHTLVPLDRVQHIDVSQGPIERGFGVCRLVVHTAGTQYSRVVLPGLSRPDAERMRDSIRARIAREPE
jgi:membrane protein YdbS with pleckstrin-like domain